LTSEYDKINSLLGTLADDLVFVKRELIRLDAIARKIETIHANTIAPRAVPFGDGFILVKLAFDDLMILVSQGDELIAPRLIMSGHYEKALTSYLRSILPKVGFAVDVGANIGYYTMEIDKRGCPSILAI
jgi:hypothetical protein